MVVYDSRVILWISCIVLAPAFCAILIWISFSFHCGRSVDSLILDHLSVIRFFPDFFTLPIDGESIRNHTKQPYNSFKYHWIDRIWRTGLMMLSPYFMVSPKSCLICCKISFFFSFGNAFQTSLSNINWACSSLASCSFQISKSVLSRLPGAF